MSSSSRFAPEVTRDTGGPVDQCIRLVLALSHGRPARSLGGTHRRTHDPEHRYEGDSSPPLEEEDLRAGSRGPRGFGLGAGAECAGARFCECAGPCGCNARSSRGGHRPQDGRRRDRRHRFARSPQGPVHSCSSHRHQPAAAAVERHADPRRLPPAAPRAGQRHQHAGQQRRRRHHADQPPQPRFEPNPGAARRAAHGSVCRGERRRHQHHSHRSRRSHRSAEGRRLGGVRLGRDRRRRQRHHPPQSQHHRGQRLLRRIPERRFERRRRQYRQRGVGRKGQLHDRRRLLQAGFDAGREPRLGVARAGLRLQLRPHRPSLNLLGQ